MSRPAVGAPHFPARLAHRLHMPLWQEIRARHDREFLYSHPAWANPGARADGLPVILVGGLATTPSDLEPLLTWLARLGARPLVAPTGRGVGCGEQLTQVVTRTVDEVLAKTGQRPILIGYSRGGQFARATAVRRPASVRHLITLGSPLTRIFAVHPLIKAHATILGLAGTIGIPGLMRAGCLWGSCCAPLRQQLTAPFPEHIPFLSIYSKNDSVVDWTSCLDLAARHREVPAPHAALPASPPVFEAIAAELDRTARHVPATPPLPGAPGDRPPIASAVPGAQPHTVAVRA